MFVHGKLHRIGLLSNDLATAAVDLGGGQWSTSARPPAKEAHDLTMLGQRGAVRCDYAAPERPAPLGGEPPGGAARRYGDRCAQAEASLPASSSDNKRGSASADRFASLSQ
jgi:hypothetical protein